MRRHGRQRRVDQVLQWSVPDYWLEQEIGDWRVAYRLGIAKGRCVISEVRIFPNEPTHRRGARRTRWDRGTTQPPGKWNGTWNGARADGIPETGITAELLRQIPIGKAATVARRVSPIGLEPRDELPLPVSVPEPSPVDAPQPRRGRPPQWTANDYKDIRQWADGGMRAIEIAARLGERVLPANASHEEQRRAAARVRTMLRRAKLLDWAAVGYTPQRRRRSPRR